MVDNFDIQEFVTSFHSANTKKAYESDWADFFEWCRAQSVVALPASPDDVARYLRGCVKLDGLCVSTVARRLSAIAAKHEEHDSDDKIRSNWVIRRTMARLRRENGRAADAKKPLLPADLKAIIKGLPDTLVAKRDKALLLIGFGGAMRRSEVVDLDVDDISIGDEGVVVFLKKSKTDQVRAGRKIGIPRGQHESSCPVAALQGWLKASKIQHGPVFRPVTKAGGIRGMRLSSKSVALIVKKYIRATGKRSAFFSGHSLRSGLCTAAAMGGAGEREIQNQTGHKNPEMVRRYIRDGQLFRNNAFKKVGL